MFTGIETIEVDEGTCTATSPTNVCPRCGSLAVVAQLGDLRPCFGLGCDCVNIRVSLDERPGVLRWTLRTALHAAWGERGAALADSIEARMLWAG